MGFRLSSFRVSLFVIILYSIACCFIPLFNYLGFEFSALSAVALSYVVGLHWIAARAKDKPVVDADRRVRLAEMSAMIVVPFSILSFNAFFIKNCSFIEGCQLYALLVIPSVAFSVSLAGFVSALASRRPKTWFFISITVVLVHVLFVTLTGPQIFAFNPVLGFFPGLTYDETLSVIPRLTVYRLGTVALSVLLFSLSSVFVSLKGRRPVGRRNLGLVLGAAAVWLLMLGMSDRLGHSSSVSSIKSALGGYKETEHFEIAYPAEKISSARLLRIANLAEFQYSRLCRTMRIAPVKKVRLFLYADDAQKGMLIGAAGTNISKPWLWQIHINADDAEVVLKHELVHVLAAEFGFPLLRIAPNSGLIEGLAVAMERVSYGEGLHKTASEIYDVGAGADIERLFSFSGFFSVHPGVSYSLAGSFCRYLIDVYGFRRFRQLYQDNDFEAHYGRSKADMVHEWHRFLETFRSSESDKARARYFFRRPTIFGKECARVIANLNRRTSDLLAKKDFEGAIGSAEASLGHSRTSEAIQQKMFALVKLKRFPEAERFAEEQFADSTLALSLFPMKFQYADAVWAQDSSEGNSPRIAHAVGMYSEIESLRVSVSWDEACELRRAVANNPKELGALKQLWVGDFTDSTRHEFLKDLFVRYKALPFSAHLYGKELYSTEHWQGAIDVLTPARPTGVDLLEYLRFQRIARSYFWLGEFEKAKMFFWESQNFTQDEVRLFETREWIERCEFSKHLVLK